MDLYIYSGALSIAEATQICSSYAKDIQDDLVYLRTKVSSHGDTILSRWKKKSREKRSALILKAFPSIFRKKWFPFYLNYDYDGWQARRPFREAILLPYLNLEILSDDPSKFLALLYQRTRFDPQDWAIFDKDKCCTAFAGGGLRAEFADCCVVLQGLNYGNVVPWDTAEAHRWDIAGFPRGRIILEGQRNLMRFLRLAVQDILDGVGEAGSSDKWNLLAMTRFQTAGLEGWSRFANQAFSPPSFDIDRLISIAKSRLSETEDHLWLLQTDVAYFQLQVKNLKQGRMFKEFDKMVGNIHTAFQIWLTPIDHLIGWQWIIEELEYTRTQYLRFRDSIQLGERLPPKFEYALASLELLLVEDIKNCKKNLALVIPSLIGFQDYYMFVNAPGPKLKLNPEKCPEIGELFHKDPLFWCLHQIMADSKDPKMFDNGLLFGFLDDCLSKDFTTTKDRARLDQNLLVGLSNLAAAHEVLNAVRQHRPRYKTITWDEAMLRGADRPVWRHKTATDGRTFDFSMEDKKAHIQLLKAIQADPFPTGRRDWQWLEHTEKCRQKLAEFWAKTREIYFKILKSCQLWTEEQLDRQFAALSFDRAPEHIVALEDERKAILASIQKSASLRSLARSNDSGTSFELPVTDTSTFELPSRPKAKVKSRPDASSIENVQRQKSEDVQINSNEQLRQTAKINVKPESLRVFSRMFPLTPEELSAKALDWQMFVRAMEDVGFSAEQSGSSAVAFIKEGAGRIVFHKPHPVPKIEQMVLQTWGRRMGKWFQWKRDLFVSEK